MSASELRAVVIDKHVTVSGLPLVHVLHGLCGLVHGPLLDPGLDALLNSKVEHLSELLRGSNTRGRDTLAKQAAAGRRETGVRKADHDAVSVRLEQREVELAERHVVLVARNEEQVEGRQVLLQDGLLVLRCDEADGAELQCVILLPLRVGDSPSLRSKSRRELDREMSETADSDNTDPFARSRSVVLQRAVHRHTSAEHGRGNLRLQSVGNRDSKVTRALVEVGVAALCHRLGLVPRLALVGADVAEEAVVLQSAGTVGTLPARVALRSEADAVAELVARLGAGLNDLADDLVPDDGGEGDAGRPAARDGVQVGLRSATGPFC